MDDAPPADLAPAIDNPAEAMEMVLAGLSYLTATDPTALSAAAQAECLQGLERANGMVTAARAWFLGAFTAGQGYAEDADYSPASWLIHKLRVTKGAARAQLSWARRTRTHPQVLLALAEGGVVTASMAGLICALNDRLPADCRTAADDILLAAAQGGARKEDLVALAAEIYARSRPESDDDPAPAFEDRQLRVETTFAGAGVIAGDLTPECAAIVTAVLESLSAPQGADDTRTREQRYHDALEEAMRRLTASGLLPQRAGQPVKMWAHISLAELRALDDGSVLETQWVTGLRIRWAAHHAEDADGSPGDAGAWLTGPGAGAVGCDSSMTPVVTGDVDLPVLDDMVRLCVQLAGYGDPGGPQTAGPPAGPVPGGPSASPVPAGPTGVQQLGGLSRDAIRQANIGKAADLLSGPGGLASFLRTRQLGARLAGPSLPLDIGFSTSIPAGIRNAVILRDRHCRWPGGCNQPAAACQVHHVTHLANGGPTSVAGCVLLCSFHHQVVIHRWGWTLVLNPDGTTTAWNPDRTKTLHSHSPPARAG
jgi:hypothetical protein